jgi:hypothetical protein
MRVFVGLIYCVSERIADRNAERLLFGTDIHHRPSNSPADGLRGRSWSYEDAWIIRGVGEYFGRKSFLFRNMEISFSHEGRCPIKIGTEGNG